MIIGCKPIVLLGVQSDLHEIAVRRVTLALKGERLAQGLSQETLAEKAGLSRTGVRHVEGGNFKPTLYTLLKLADALGVDICTLIREAYQPE